MPFNGLTSFLHELQKAIKALTLKGCVNALQRAYIISTDVMPFMLNSMTNCVNALQRAYIISTTATATANMTTPQVCQCPSTGLHHFYGKDARCCSKCEYVSMPFNGLTSFLQFMRSCS